MDWIRSMDLLGGGPSASAHHLHAEPLREPDADEQTASRPTFRIVDAKNRVHEVSHSASMASSSSSSSSMLLPMSRPLVMASSRPYAQGGDDADMLDDEDAQLAQQLAFQREEMQFTRPLPRITPPPSHPFPSQSAQNTNNGSTATSSSMFRSATNSHAFSYSDSTSSPLHHQLNPLKTPPTVPPVSPFAGLALSAPAKSTIGTPNPKPPVNPFSNISLNALQQQQPSSANSLATSIENSPRLPSLNAFRAGSPRNLKLGIAARPPTLSLRGSGGFADSSPHLGPSSLSSTVVSTPLPSLSSSMPSPLHSVTSPYSHSLPGLSYLQERLTRQQSFDGEDSVTNASSDDEERDSAMLMMRLSSSVPSDGMADALNGQRSGRVCRYSDCNNIARSRGLCRTHGGGKRCSQLGCNKSAQANRKCIAHGGGTPCSFDDCEKTAQSRGLCKAHGGGARCKHPNCPKSSQSKGLCRGHGGGIKCKEDGCEKWVQKNGYCIKHGRERAMTQ